MLTRIISTIIISIIIVALIHYLYLWLSNNLTSPKTKDYITIPRKKYNEIYENINSYKETNPKINTSYNLEKNNQNILDNESMKNELKSYLSNLTQDVTSYSTQEYTVF
jgi:predicted PurR-regulated permease PerM|tara:strand:- start:1873 stop:2199 length:327 start_codon:yes stop_codon:yes gene_type:complete